MTIVDDKLGTIDQIVNTDFGDFDGIIGAINIVNGLPGDLDDMKEWLDGMDAPNGVTMGECILFTDPKT